MEKQVIENKCFEINRIPYHLKLIQKFSRRWKDTGSSVKSHLMALSGIHNYIERRGNVEYNTDESSEIRKGRFEETWTEEYETSSHYLKIKLMGKPKIEIILESCYLDNGAGKSRITTKQREGFMRWTKVPSNEIFCELESH